MTPEDFGLKREDWDDEHWGYHVAIAAAFHRANLIVRDAEIVDKRFFPFFIESYGDMAQIVQDAIKAWKTLGGSP